MSKGQADKIIDSRSWAPIEPAKEFLALIEKNNIPSPSSFAVNFDGTLYLVNPENNLSKVTLRPAPRLFPFLKFTACLTQLLNWRLSPDEQQCVGSVQLRYSRGTQSFGKQYGFHEDPGGYIRVMTTLIGAGTLYKDKRGRVHQTPTGDSLIVNSRKRHRASKGKNPVLIHSSPDFAGPRISLMVDFLLRSTRESRPLSAGSPKTYAPKFV